MGVGAGDQNTHRRLQDQKVFVREFFLCGKFAAMEPTEMKLKGPTESGSEEVVTLMHSRGEVGEAAATQEEHQQQQQNRGLKRSRRESRGSSAKERISKMPPCEAGKRSSIYRGVTRHRWTGRYEAHLWDKTTWNETQNKKGKQVYLGAYDDEEAAARAYDLAALKYWGPGTLINFPVTDYSRDVDEMQALSREEYLASLRRKSSGFSRGVAAKYRAAVGGSTIAAAAKHSPSARWEARIGRVLGNKYVYLGNPSSSCWAEESPSTSFEAATEYRGLNAVTNFDLTRYTQDIIFLPSFFCFSFLSKPLNPRTSGSKCIKVCSFVRHFGKQTRFSS